MLELTWLIFDFFIAIVLILALKSVIPEMAKAFGLKIVIKLEKLSKKEIINNLKEEIELAKAKNRN